MPPTLRMTRFSASDMTGRRPDVDASSSWTLHHPRRTARNSIAAAARSHQRRHRQPRCGRELASGSAAAETSVLNSTGWWNSRRVRHDVGGTRYGRRRQRATSSALRSSPASTGREDRHRVEPALDKSASSTSRRAFPLSTGTGPVCRLQHRAAKTSPSRDLRRVGHRTISTLSTCPLSTAPDVGRAIDQRSDGDTSSRGDWRRARGRSPTTTTTTSKTRDAAARRSQSGCCR